MDVDDLKPQGARASTSMVTALVYMEYSVGHTDGSVQDCGDSIANALEFLQFYAMLLKWAWLIH